MPHFIPELVFIVKDVREAVGQQIQIMMHSN